MKLAITSDLHIGDEWCRLVVKEKGTYKLGPMYDGLKKKLNSFNKDGNGLDYLVLLGDVFDFSVCGYVETFKQARLFFQNLVDDCECAPEAIIFIPGNHDYSFWHWVELQVNVIGRIANGDPPRDFKWSVPGVIDERKKAQKGLFLKGVSKKKTKGSPGHGAYGGLFLDSLTKTKKHPGGIPFYVVYPNLYLVNDTGSVLVTHGHYLEAYWSLVSQFGPLVLGKDLKVGELLDMKELVAVNVPVNVLASAGIGQAGKLSDWIKSVQHEIKGKDFKNVKRYLENLDDKIWDPYMGFSKYHYKEWATDLIADYVKKKIIEGLENAEKPRYNDQWLRIEAVRTRLETFYKAVVDEAFLLSHDAEFKSPAPIDAPTRVVWGHTHTPVAWDDPQERKLLNGNVVLFHNTGGWLHSDEEPGEGAEIFFWKDGEMSSSLVPPK